MKSRAEKLNLIDDRFFRAAAKNKSFCEELCRAIYKDPKLVVLENTVEWDGNNLYGRSVKLDLKCVLGNGASVDVEIQKSDNDNHQKRVRYNGAILTTNITDPGVNFEHVPDVRVVYISRFDVFKKGCLVYHVDRVLREGNEVLGNGFEEIYINATMLDVDESMEYEAKIAELMRIFTQDDAYNDELFPVISAVKRSFKETEEGKKVMCGIEQEIFRDGIAEGEASGLIKGREEGEAVGLVIGRAEGEVKGKKKGIVESINHMVNKLGLTPNAAMDVLDISVEEREDYKRLLSQQ